MWRVASILGCFAWGKGGSHCMVCFAWGEGGSHCMVCFAWGEGGSHCMVDSEKDIFCPHWSKETVSLNKPNSEF